MNVLTSVKKVLGVTALLMAANSWGLTINGTTDVGVLDTLIGWTSGLANSSPATELAYANFLLNPDTTFTIKTEPVSYVEVDEGGAYAFALQSDPGYFIVKNSTFWALFQNNASTEWGVFSLTGLPSGMNLGGEEFQISHVTEFGGSVNVPEPASVGLLVVGLLGLAVARRRVHRV